MNDNTAILALTDIIQLPEAERLQAIKDKFSAKSHDELLNLLGNVLNVAVNYAQSCDETLYLHLVTTGDMHPYAIDKLISPSFHGALNGLILAQKAPNQDVLCESCAYRCGTLANHCLTTQSDLAHALESDAVFYCHKDIENLDCPTSEDKTRMKPCKGWAQHVKKKGGGSMKYGSVCSGIEAATVAWHELGWQPAWFSEIEKFPSQVLAHHYPSVKNLGDMTFIAEKIRNSEIEAPEVLVGGTPCQAFSVAGLRNSLDDDRGQLSLEFVRLANEIDSARFIRGQQPSIIVWENVPGVLSTKDNAFGCFLGALSGEGCELKPTGKKWTNTGCVFGPQRQIAWRVLDAQHFGLAQRRKRVFVVASARTESITEILFERKSMHRDSTQSRGKTENTTRCGEIHTNRASTSISAKTYTPPILASHGQKKWLGNQEALCGDYYIKHTIGVGGMTANAAISQELYPTLLANHDKGCVISSFGVQENIIGRSINAGGNGLGFKEEQAPTLTSMDRHGVVVHGTQDPIISCDIAHCLGRNSGQENVLCESAYAMIADTTPKVSKEINGTLRSSGGGGGGIVPSSVIFMSIARYLTEIECERLQGFPDNYTNIPKASATARYKSLGNSMAVPVMRWIGRRIQQYCEVV